MLISHRKKFIYTKTIKTASTSVECYFEKFCMPEKEWKLTHHRNEYESEHGVIGYRGPDKSNKKWYNHMPAALIKSMVGETTWNDYFKFCVIRNPFEKVLSAFFHFYVNKKNIIADKSCLIILFQEWIQSRQFIKPERQIYMIDDKICMDYFIKYENLHQDLKNVCRKINVPFKPKEVPRFKSDFRPKDLNYIDFYDNRSKQILKQAYSFEFGHFYSHL